MTHSQATTEQPHRSGRDHRQDAGHNTQGGPITNVRNEAARYLAAGLSIIPIKPDGSKSPACGAWAEFQKEHPTKAQASAWFRNSVGVAVIGGAVSGNLEILDFDVPGLYERYESLANDNGLGDLVRKLPMAETPSGGRHCYYRTEQSVGPRKILARTETGGTAIETRSEGNYAIVPPSPAACHPDGKPYVMRRGDLAALPVLRPDDVRALYALARVCNEYREPETATATTERTERPERRLNTGLRPGDDYNERGPVLELLQRHGWKGTRAGHGYNLTRPGKSHGTSATFDVAHAGLFYCFTSSAPPFDAQRGYSPFAVYALLEHNGDYAAAASALYADGYGDRVEAKSGAGASFGTMEPPIVPDLPEGESLTFEEWEQRGRDLHTWKSRMDNAYRWAIGDWWNLLDEEHGGKYTVGKDLFGDTFATVRRWATVCKAWPKETRQDDLFFWIHAELAGQSEETRQKYLQEFRRPRKKGEPGLNREDLRAKLNITTKKREPKPWDQVKRDLPNKLAEHINDAIAREGSTTVYQKLMVALGIAPERDNREFTDDDVPIYNDSDEPEEYDDLPNQAPAPDLDTQIAHLPEKSAYIESRHKNDSSPTVPDVPFPFADVAPSDRFVAVVACASSPPAADDNSPLRLIDERPIDLPADLLPYADLITDHGAGRLPDGYMRLNQETRTGTAKFSTWVGSCLRSYERVLDEAERQKQLAEIAEAAAAWRAAQKIKVTT